jgi:sulfur-oxidizing protein SoxY
MHRRTFLKSTFAGAAVAMAATAGMLKPTRVLAAEWPKAAFDARSLEDALKSLYGVSQTAPSGAITIKAQLQAEDGANVPFTVAVNMPNVEALSVYITKNERPLVANLALSGASPYISMRMKMSQSSDVFAVVRAGGKLHIAKHNIKVTVGGCGG